MSGDEFFLAKYTGLGLLFIIVFCFACVGVLISFLPTKEPPPAGEERIKKQLKQHHW